MRLVTLPGVFSPISDTWLLADTLDREPLPPGARVLDLCSGSGALAVRAAARDPSRTVVAVDVSRRATLTIRLNAALNGVRVDARRGDLFEAVAGERFDAIVSNPPYVPAATDEIPPAGAHGRGTPAATAARCSTGSARAPRGTSTPAAWSCSCTRRCSATSRRPQRSPGSTPTSPPPNAAGSVR